MALQTFKGWAWLPSPPPDSTPAFLTHLLNAADEAAAVVFRSPKTGTIKKIGFRTGTVTTGATLDITMETVSLVDGSPTGTAYGGSSAETQVVDATDDNTWFDVTFTTGATTTQGDILAVKVANPTLSFGNLNISTHTMITALVAGFPYTTLFTGVWTKSTSKGPVLSIEYSDGSYENIYSFPMTAVTATNFAETATPNERGIRFKVPFSLRVAGAWVYVRLDTGDLDIKLYDSDGSTVLQTITIDNDVSPPSGKYGVYLFPSSQVLLAATFYRLVVAPSSGVNVSAFQSFSVNAAAIMDMFDGGQDFHETTAKDPTEEADWTNTATNRPLMGLLIDQLDDGVSAGGGAAARYVRFP